MAGLEERSNGGASGDSSNAAGSGGSTGGSDALACDDTSFTSWPDSGTAFCTDGTVEVSCNCSPAQTVDQDGCDAPGENSARFAGDLSDRGTLDTLTGIVWSKGTASMSFEAASAECANRGARLASVSELVSLLDYGADQLVPSGFGLSNDGDALYWASTGNASSQTWVVSLDSGGVAIAETDTHPFLCASCSRVGDIQYVSHAEDGVVQAELDGVPFLEWQISFGKLASWTVGLQNCVLDAGEGYELPTVKEAALLLEGSVLPGDFSHYESGEVIYWTQTPVRNAPEKSWVIDYEKRTLRPALSSENHGSRCVKKL